MTEQIESNFQEPPIDPLPPPEAASEAATPADSPTGPILELIPLEERSVGRGRFSLAAITFGLLALLTFPLAFGLPALICATVAHLRHEPWRWPGSLVAVSGALIGLAILIVTRQL